LAGFVFIKRRRPVTKGKILDAIERELAGEAGHEAPPQPRRLRSD
jgi:hypothetical protein